MARAEHYDHQRREELLPYIPESAATILDLGCASGDFGRALMETRPVTVDGIEPDEHAAKEARDGYRSVLVGTFPEIRPSGTYDVITCLDVLEHMVDPWVSVADLRPYLAPDGVVVASIPNMRYWPVLRSLLRGRFDYADDGVMDRTHLRWFTKATMTEMFEQAGYTVVGIERLTGLRGGVKWRLIGCFFPRFVDDTLTKQYVVTAR